MSHVFISYDRGSDGDFVAAVQLELQRAGFEAWTDREIEAGHAWQEKVDAAIRDALALVLVLSPDALQSVYVAYEWAFALGAGVRVIPLRRRVEASALHARLRVLDVLDFSNDRIRPWAELLEALRSAAQEAQDPSRALRAGVSDAVRTAARALDSVHEAERDAALDSLEQMTDPGAKEVLANALGHPVQAVRYRAACLLGDKGDARAIDVLVAQLVSPPVNVSRIQAALSRLGTDALPRLDALCEHSNETVRDAAVLALATIDPGRAAERLLAASRDPSAGVRSSAVFGLGHIGNDPRATAAVVERSVDADARVRCSAALALGNLGGDVAVKHLGRLAQDPDRDTRRFAIEALGAARSVAGIEALVAAADTDQEETRRFCAEALGMSSRPEAVPVLVEMLRDSEEMVSNSAWNALGRLEGPQATGALLSLLEDADLSMRETAVNTLRGRHDPSAAGGLLAALERATEPTLISGCCAALGELRVEVAVPALAARLGHADPEVVKAARSALDQIGTPEARQALAATRKRAR